MISEQYKCIFIHVPKTGGTSIEKKLGWFKEVHTGCQDHRTIEEILSSIPNSETLHMEQYFIFTIVRNSWSRVFSRYKDMEKGNTPNDIGLSYMPSFQEYVECHLDKDWPALSQLHWLKNASGKVSMDFIGRFETLQEDFRYVCGRLNIEDYTLPKLLASNNPPYAQGYTPKMIDIVRKQYEEEISLFNFTFGD